MTTETASNGKRGLFWPILVVGLLLGHIAAVTTLIVSATGDPSHQVVPNYYQRAVKWDERMAQAQRSAQLGWHAELSFKRCSSGALATLVVKDQAGRELSAGVATVEAFHKARSADVVRAVIRDDGGYSAVLPMKRLGLWQISITFRHGGQTFTQLLQRDLAQAPVVARCTR